MTEKQMCLACGQKEATSTQGTVPLCADCAALATGKGRGVNYQEKPKDGPTGVKAE